MAGAGNLQSPGAPKRHAVFVLGPQPGGLSDPEAEMCFFHEKIEILFGPTYLSGRTVSFLKIGQIMFIFCGIRGN